jgi:hypothetical protein
MDEIDAQVLGALADFANGVTVQPTTVMIATEIGQPRRVVYQALRRLERKGKVESAYVQRDDHPRERGWSLTVMFPFGASTIAEQAS